MIFFVIYNEISIVLVFSLPGPYQHSLFSTFSHFFTYLHLH